MPTSDVFPETIFGGAEPYVSPAPAAVLPPSAHQEEGLLPGPEIERALGQSVRAALDLDSWSENRSLEQMLDHVQAFVKGSLGEETRLRALVRRHVLNALHEFPDAPQCAGVYAVSESHRRAARRNILLRGQATAVDGACTGHDGLAASLVSIGVSLARYDGAMNSWRTTFLRHDYDLAGDDPVEEIRGLLNRRDRRDGNRTGPKRDLLSYMLRRGFMAAAERKVLLERADTRWRIGHGVPAPMELLTGSGSMDLIEEALPLLDNLLLREKRWVFVLTSAASRAFATMANALDPGQVAIFQKTKPSLDALVEGGTYYPGYKGRVLEFAARLGEATVIGGFRATPHSPGQLFVAPAEHAVTAGILALADAAVQPHRGFPLLLDLAWVSAKTHLGIEAYAGIVETAYAKAGAGGMFSPDRVWSADFR